MTARTITLTRAEAFRLYMAATEGSVLYEEEHDGRGSASARKAYERAMHRLAVTFRFRDHYPEADA